MSKMTQAYTIEKYLSELRGDLKFFEQKEHYEWCVGIRDQIKAIEEFDIPAYIRLNFDIKGLTECGFLESGETTDQIADRIRTFFGLESIFDYSIILGRKVFTPFCQITELNSAH